MTQKHQLAFLLKSYSQDFELASRMVASFHAFNQDNIPLYVVVPDSDLKLLESLVAENVTLISEIKFDKHLVSEPVHDLRPGYINQEIVKLAFWELGLTENYFCIDSDAEFIRPFTVSDFMFDSQTPYSVLVQDLELAVEPTYYSQYWQSREKELEHIATLLELDTRVILTCHGHQVFSAKVLESFVNEFLIPRGWDYRDALAQAPYEFTWYNLWLQKIKPHEIHPREPWVKVFHHEGQYLEYVSRGVSVTDLARGYLAVVINSSFARELPQTPSASANSKSQALAQHLSYGEVVKLIQAKVKDTARNRFTN
jgi:hypothetical protein